MDNDHRHYISITREMLGEEAPKDHFLSSLKEINVIAIVCRIPLLLEPIDRREEDLLCALECAKRMIEENRLKNVVVLAGTLSPESDE